METYPGHNGRAHRTEAFTLVTQHNVTSQFEIEEMRMHLYTLTGDNV